MSLLKRIEQGQRAGRIIEVPSKPETTGEVIDGLRNGLGDSSDKAFFIKQAETFLDSFNHVEDFIDQLRSELNSSVYSVSFRQTVLDLFNQWYPENNLHAFLDTKDRGLGFGD